MMKTEMVLETSVSFIHLTRLIAREDFIEQTQIISIKFNGLFFCEKIRDILLGVPPLFPFWKSFHCFHIYCRNNGWDN
jgi:hypothetical protein